MGVRIGSPSENTVPKLWWNKRKWFRNSLRGGFPLNPCIKFGQR